MQRNRLHVGATLVALLLAPGLASAAIIGFSDDFTTDTAVSGTDVSHPQIQPGDVGKQWTVRHGTDVPHHVQVRSDDPVNPPNNHLRLVRSGSLFGYAHAQLTDAHNLMTVDQPVTISFRLFLSTDQATNGNSELRVLGHPVNTTGDGAPASFVDNAFSLRFLGAAGTEGNQRPVIPLGGADVPGSEGTATYMYGEWNDVAIHVDYGARTFFVQVTSPTLGTTTSATRTFQLNSVDRLGTIQFTTPRSDTPMVLLDDVLVEIVPEPGAALALLIVGGLALRRRRV